MGSSFRANPYAGHPGLENEEAPKTMRVPMNRLIAQMLDIGAEMRSFLEAAGHAHDQAKIHMLFANSYIFTSIKKC
jgi:hypothetical protein